ncbi:MAG TPA: ABC transporter permease [Gemmatimonadaceae bacterium]|nr:ABC transporter permease [Gemmatimonadaceae bacterium]
MRRVFRIPFSRMSVVRDVDDEIRFHLQSRIDALVVSGMSPAAARDAAMRQFGDLAGVRSTMVSLDRQRDATARRASVLGELAQDIRYGLRTLRRNAALTALVVGGLALGIGVNGAIYSLIDAILLRKLPVKDPDGLVIVGNPSNVDSRGHGTPDGVLYSYPLYLDIRDNDAAFDGLAAVGDADRVDAGIDSGSPELEHPRGRLVSGNYFVVLGVHAAAGRTLDASVDVPGAPVQATISYAYWMRRFHGDRTVVGRDILVDGLRATITGVTTPAFTGDIVGTSTDIWLPLAMRDRLHPNAPVLRDRRMMWLLLIGRARPGFTLDRVRAETTPIVRSSILAHAAPDELADIKDRGFTVAVASGARGLSWARGTFGAPLVTLMLGVVLLLCIVCVNVANLLLARGVARRREMSMRLAIGASRARIVRQLLTESVLLALVSGVAALLVAWWGEGILVSMASAGEPIAVPVALNANVLAFTLAVALASVMVFGLIPALRASRVDLASALRAGSRSVSHGARFGTLMISAQVALSLLLLVGASILTRSLRRAESISLGLDRDHMIVADLDIATPGYASQRLASFVHALHDRVAAIPGVVGVSYSTNGIFSGTEWHTDVTVAGRVARTSQDTVSAADRVGAGYVHAIGARLVAGRDFGMQDEGVPVRTALVNESFARFYFPNTSPIGQLARFDDSSVVQIVGEIADAHSQSLDTTGAPGSARRIYVPYLDESGTTKFSQPGSLRLLVRTSADPSATIQAVRRAIVETDRAVAIDDLESLTDLVRFSIRDRRLLAHLATGLGALALLLAAIGLFGVMSYSIARRTGEIGVRMALGARRADIARLVMRDGLRPVFVGVALGLPASLIAVRLLQRYLDDIASDPASIVAAVAVLLLSAALAVFVPARRATHVDPVGALREE